MAALKRTRQQNLQARREEPAKGAGVETVEAAADSTRRGPAGKVESKLLVGLLLSGLVSGLLVLLLLLVLMMSLSGLTPLGFWLSGFLSLVLCTGLLMVEILELVVFLMLNYLFYLSFGLVRGCLWRRLSLGIFVLRAQFQCRLSFWSRH